jgi:ADP-ribosylation factor 2-binding protein
MSEKHDDDDLLCLGDDDGEEVYLETSGSAEEVEFDGICGAIEEILIMDEVFLSTQRQFCDEHCRIFEDTEENKMEYTGLFGQYTALMEKTLEERLASKVPGFSMRRFEMQLIDRKDEIGGEIFDLLLSFSDFAEFKATMLAHKATFFAGDDAPAGLSLTGNKIGPSVGKKGGVSPDLSVGGLSISGLSVSGSGKGSSGKAVGGSGLSISGKGL